MKEEIKKEAAEKQVALPEKEVPSFITNDSGLSHQYCPETSATINQSDMANQTYAKASILRIIGALNGAGCNSCAALIVAKQELKKFKEVS